MAKLVARGSGVSGANNNTVVTRPMGAAVTMGEGGAQMPGVAAPCVGGGVHLLLEGTGRCVTCKEQIRGKRHERQAKGGCPDEFG